MSLNCFCLLLTQIIINTNFIFKTKTTILFLKVMRSYKQGLKHVKHFKVKKN